jgi:hypothetical protein
MPSLPTSLIIVGLVAAWLVVLVPMVAKRREQVPENTEESANFRVLRPGSKARRRPILSRTAMAHRSHLDDGDAQAADRVASPADEDDRESVRARDTAEDPADDAATDIQRRAGDEAMTESSYQAPQRAGYDDVRGDAGSRFETDRDEGRDRAESRESARASHGRAGAAVDDGREYRRTPIRPGRGGFDPAAADRASAYRFRQRQRVALTLVALAIAGAVVGVFGPAYGYMAAAVSGVTLVLYLAYLRRQVRIESEIRRRREARLARARQIRPGYRPSVAEQVYAHRTGEFPRPGEVEEFRVTSHARQTVPPAGFGYGEPVDFEDSDPAFDDLEYYRPAVYRRRAG